MALLDNLPQDAGNPTFYTESIRTVFDDFIPSLVASTSTKTVTVSPGDAVEWEYDLYGYLYSLKIAQRYHFIIMRMNDLMSPLDWHRDVNGRYDHMLTLLIPDSREIDAIVQAENTGSIVGLT